VLVLHFSAERLLVLILYQFCAGFVSTYFALGFADFGKIDLDKISQLIGKGLWDSLFLA
jgi:hypothetical protein